MKDEERTKGQLIEEITFLREQVSLLERAEGDRKVEWQELFDFLKDYVSVLDSEGKIIFANRAFLDRFGYEWEEILDSDFRDIIPPASRQELEDALFGVTGYSGRTFLTPLFVKGGSEIPVELTFSRREWGGRTLCFLSGRDIQGEGQAERLREGQAHFLQTLIDAVPTPIFFEGLDLKYLGVNRAFNEYHGVSGNELIGRNIYHLLPKDEADRHHKEDLALLEGGGKVSYEFRIVLADGSVRNVINSKGVFRRPDGTVGGIVGVITDVTERKKTQEELEHQGRILDIMTGQMEDMVYYKDKDFRYVFSSKPHCERVLKCSQEECLGRTDKEISGLGRHGDETGPEGIYGKSDHETQEAGKPSKFEEMTAVGGEKVWLEIYNTPLYDENGAFAGIVGCSRDITERKRSEQMLKESEERLRMLIEGTNDVITLQDRTGIFSYYNGAHRYGYESETILGKAPHEVFHPSEASRSMQHTNYVFETGRSLTTEEDVIRGGERLWFNVNRYPIRDEKSNIVSVATISRNITDRKRMEENLIKSQKLESIGTLAGGIAHDFNNILTVMLGNITLAKMSINPENKAIKRLKDAEKATMRAKDLTQQLLTFAKGGEPFKRVVSMNRLIEDSVNLSLSGSNVKCDYEIAEDLFPVEIDEGQIRQVIHNVIVNAKEAMPSGGVVDIRARNVTLEGGNDLSLEKGHYVRIDITDRGPGIPGAYLPKIFDPYFTTKEMGSKKGTGLGLAICYSIVRKHNGHIKVESNVGAGTTFAVYLPAYDRDSAEEKRVEGGRPQNQGKILLMDDEEMIREITAEILGALGYNAAFAKNGDEAIKMYEDARNSGEPFDLVILDLTIPGGMGGKETIQKLIDLDPRVKGIVSSGYSNDPVMAEFRKYGFSGIITKPFKIEELNEVLRTIIAE
jgi:PAS domain S-box-containing protein